MKQVLGYFLGFAIFIVGIPALMWLVSGMPAIASIPTGRLILSALIAMAGLSLSVWSIVYMKSVGKGNPFDAMGHEVAPRTKHLMTDGPYRLSRNLAGLMMLQVRSEEKRLEADFGEEYLEYKKRTGRFFTFRNSL